MTQTRKRAPRGEAKPRRFVIENLSARAREHLKRAAANERPRTSAGALAEYWLEAIAKGDAEIVFKKTANAA